MPPSGCLVKLAKALCIDLEDTYTFQCPQQTELPEKIRGALQLMMNLYSSFAWSMICELESGSSQGTEKTRLSERRSFLCEDSGPMTDAFV